MALPPFRNEPFTDFSQPEHRAAMERALEQVRGQLGQTYPLIIGGERITTEHTLESRNPARPDELVGRASSATAEHVHQAMDAAERAFEEWRRVPVEQRADLLVRAAAEMRRRKFELAAWMVFEVSKSWVEADADVAEAIDFCEFYARQMLRIAQPPELVQLPGERDTFRYIPLGPGAVIPPWNFPLAIAVGMSLAAVVAGNTVVLKPSPRSPVIAAQFMTVLEAVGAPAGVVNFITGEDAVIGDLLVDHPKSHFVSFTGSKEIGLRIMERAAKRQPGQKWLKRTVLEMGGKDTIVVDETADIDAAAEAVVASAFGFQGQKCSACSRVVAVDAVYDTLLEKTVERARRLSVGNPALPETQLGAVIDGRSQDKIREYLEIGRREGRLVLGGEAGGEGFFVQPTIFADLAPDARLMQEEIFGPVVGFCRARDFDQALEIANNTEYALTGGVFSRDPARLERAREDFHVGNLYFNRKITGAMVGAHPFGGFKMSGTDSKAGGHDYLLLFVQGKSIAERILPGTGTGQGGE
ncbi:MAG: L-glutamate gamma-semialdehyde dehydrogenase [Roseiflexaceae bacterium]